MADLILLIIQIIITMIFSSIKPFLIAIEWVVFNIYSLVINLALNVIFLIIENVKFKPTKFIKFKGI